VKAVEFDINDIANTGAVRDSPPYMLPPETWTTVLNMRVLNKGLEKLSGWEQVFGTPTVAPHFHLPVSTDAANFWLYASLTKIYAFDGTTHTNITRQLAAVDVDYTVTNGREWNSTRFGSVPIMNNGADIPQFWSAISVGTKMANLTNWTTTLRARVVRAFGPFLVAINLIDNSVSMPHTIQWSHPADPGSIPSSWDYTDPAVDAGRRDFSDVDAGVLHDALPLGPVMFIYKGSSVWKMRFIGGRFIFDFGEAAWLSTVGLLAPRCVALTGDGQKHVFASQDDILWHNGNSVQSILTDRQKSRLFSEIDTTNFMNSFMFCNPNFNEMWFCYPSAGQVFPDKALVMNYGTGGVWPLTEADGITFRWAVTGGIESPPDEEWDEGTDEWDEDTGAWSELQRRRVILAGTAATKFYNMDRGGTRDGTTFTTNLRRDGLALIGKRRNGELIVDHQVMKMLKRVWPKIQGNPVSIRFGAQQVVNGPTTWFPSVTFDPATETFCDPGIATGRAVSIEFTADASWRIDGYKIDMLALGGF